MAKTSSIRFPNMIDPARNIVNVVEDSVSVVNRTRLLMLTDPTEVYNEPEFGVGLKQYLWQYNGATVRGMIHDRIKKQLRLWEPYVSPEDTEFADGLVFTEGNVPVSIQSLSELKLTVGLRTKFGESAKLDLSKEL